MLLASCGVPGGTKPPVRFELPPDFGPVAWTTSPANVVRNPEAGTPVVWVGRVTDFSYVRRDDGLVVEWVCESLPFAAPGFDAIQRRPIAVHGQSNGRFLVNLVDVGIAEDAARTMKRQYDRAPHYLLVAGTVDSVVERDGRPTVFLHTKVFELTQGLVTGAE
jgi:hypothetical protein